MSIATLVQVYDEVRRLAIAGSSTAGGDFRLKKLIAPLEQAGTKSPVFAKVAQAAQAVVSSSDKTASPALLDLATLVSAILYTQGQTGVEGPLEPLPTTELSSRSTKTPARIIKPLITALTSKGSSRVELIKDAVDRKLFNDLRLVKPAVGAIDDPSFEVADLIVQNVLPLYGESILPDLRVGFDLESSARGQQLRLKLMHRLDAVGTRETLEKVLAEGSKAMKVAAIECLGDSEADAGLLIQQSRAKAQEVRAAALGAMLKAPSRTPEALKILFKALDGNDLTHITHAVSSANVPEVDAAVIELAREKMESLLKPKDEKHIGPTIDRLILLIMCMDGVRNPAAERLLLECLDHAATFAPYKTQPASGADLNELVAIRLAAGTEAMKRRVAATALSATGRWYEAALVAACETMSAGEFYDRFQVHLVATSKRRGFDAERVSALQRLLIHGTRRLGYGYDEAPDSEEVAAKRPPLDARWLDLAVERDFPEVVCRLARPGHAKCNDYLTALVKKQKTPDGRDGIVRAMLKVSHPAGVSSLVELIKSLSKATGYHYSAYRLRALLALVPHSALPVLEALVPEVTGQFVDPIVERIADLRMKSDGV